MFIFILVCWCLGGGWETVNNQHSLATVPWPIGFCILKKRTNLHLILHFLPRHLLGKMQLPFFSHSQWSCWSRRLTKTGPLAIHRKIQNLIQQTFREEYQTNIHALWSLHSGYTIIRWINVCCIDFAIIHVSMYDVVDACSVHFSEHVHYTQNPVITQKWISLCLSPVKDWQLRGHIPQCFPSTAGPYSEALWPELMI